MKKTLMLAGTLILTLALPVFAAPITINSVNAHWSNIADGSNVTGEYTNRIRWGGTGTKKSGYRFKGSAPGSFDVSLGQNFSLGKLTHYNYVIPSGTSISGAQLNLSLNMSINGHALNDVGEFRFQFLHNETPNNCKGFNCSNDIVDFSNLMSTDTFSVDGILYSLNLSGFMQKGVMTESFSTKENKKNTAKLMGVFAIVSVPEPGSLTLFGLGLLGLAIHRKTRVTSA